MRALSVAAALVLGIAPVPADDRELPDAARVEAAYLRNFARYVTWPQRAAGAPGSPWRIGVLGRDRFADVLEQVLQGRTEGQRSFTVHRADALEHLPPCHIVFVGFRDGTRRRAALGGLRGQPVLTVGDALGFLEEGGIVQLEVGETVRMSVNLDQARAGALEIQTRILEVSREVVENGAVRVRR